MAWVRWRICSTSARSLSVGSSVVAASLERDGDDVAPVDERPVGTVQVREHPRPVLAAQLGVMTGRGRVIEHHVAIGNATKQHEVGFEFKDPADVRAGAADELSH
jgi:hypothetical protein